MIRINCDIGERGPDHVVDKKLMEVIHIANLACGGHAGNSESVNVFRALAEANGVELAAHLSYPDQLNFGRQVLQISEPALLTALDKQLGLLPDVRRVKFHGALYNESCRDPYLAEILGQWLEQAGILEILAPAAAEITFSAQRHGIAVLHEAFAERRYEYNETDQRLYLVDRSQIHASIIDLATALKQAEDIIKHRRVNISLQNSSLLVWKTISADTICVHSDSVIALDLAIGLRRLIETYHGE
jgi:UPF0271 protein